MIVYAIGMGLKTHINSIANHLKEIESLPPKGALGQVWLKLGPAVESSIFVCGGQCSILLVRGDKISWVTGLFHYNALLY